MKWLGFFTATAERRIAVALVLFLLALYVPFAGNYGMWDPWETHYSEVARQMLMRHDYVSLWWPGSPQDRNEFWSKPVLTFWLMAIGMAVTGLERADHRYDGEMAVGWLSEWSVRIPFILCAIICVWAVWELTRRLAGRRAGMWAAIVLGTSSQFFYVARQAMTDMAFVAPMAVALCLSGLALLLPPEEVEAALPRRALGFGPPWLARLSFPKTPSFYALLVLVALTIVPQLILISVQVKLSFVTPKLPGIGAKNITLAGVVPMLPWIGALLAFLYYGARATCRRQIYLHIAFLMCGLATLAKGPAGLAMPVLVVVLHLLLGGDFTRLLALDPLDPGAGLDDGRAKWKRTTFAIGRGVKRFLVAHPLELGLGVLVFIAVTFPWYHGMLIRHGMGFWNEFIGDNYVHRAAGRHGDRGTFEYYLEQIGIGMFPWSGIVPAAALAALGKLRGLSSRAKLYAFSLSWFLVMFGVVSLVNTKFHHYILPALPALAILAGLFLDDLTTHPRLRDAFAVLLLGVPFLGLAARDLVMFPARLTWLFDYDYVNAPNGGRPWPQPPTWQGYEYGTRIGVFVGFALLATILVGAIAWSRARRNERALPDDVDAAGPSRKALAALLAIPIVATIIAEVWQPAFGDGTPHPLANGWILVGVAGSLFLVVLVGAGLGEGRTRAATFGLLATGMMGCAWTGWGLDRLLTDLSPHWSQKHVIAAYYQNRKSPDEPLVAWQMYWRGETFYTKNAIYDHRVDAKDKTVFLGDRNAEKLQAYLKAHGGRRVFFIVERSRFEALRALLPDAAKPSLKPVDETNNKVYLAVAELPPG